MINPLGPIAVIAIGRLLPIKPAIEPRIEAIALAGIATATKGLQVTNVVGATSSEGFDVVNF